MNHLDWGFVILAALLWYTFGLAAICMIPDKRDKKPILFVRIMFFIMLMLIVAPFGLFAFAMALDERS
jgi:hypothetical protein